MGSDGNNSDFFDIVLKAATEEALILRSGGAEPSKPYEEKMRATLDAYMPKQRAQWARAAALLAACLFAAALAAFSFVPSVRSAAASRAMRWLSQYATFDWQGEGRSAPAIRYLPEGFCLVSSESVGSVAVQVHSDEAGLELFFSCAPKSAKLMLNDEDVEIGITMANGIEFHTFRSLKEGVESAVAWEYGQWQLQVSARLPLEELLRAAVSVEY